MGLSDADKMELLDSGTQTRWANRVSWAASYLFQAKILQRPKKGTIEVTDRGREILKSPPEKITVKWLNQFPEFQEFQAKSKSVANGVEKPLVPVVDISPQELLETTYFQYRSGLAQEVLAQCKQASPGFFERLVVQLLVAMGYGGTFKDAAMAIGKSGDGGIDGIIKEDRLGLDFMAIQAKRWEHSVGREVVQAFAGSLMGRGALKGVLITTSTLTSGAREFASKLATNKIILVDGEQLADLMLDFGIGVTETATYHVQKVDSDYFAED
jgi:restriction system protein